MIAHSPQNPRERQLEVERVLAARGLLRGPRRSLTKQQRPLAPEATARELRPALEELGPVFAEFGRYLSLRADLLRSSDCLLLEGIPDVAQATTPEVVDQILTDELGQPRADVFPVFEDVPFEVRWRTQSHHAALKGGERVVVKVGHPGRRQLVESELEALTVLRGLFTSTDFVVGDHFDEVQADFRVALAARLDLQTESAALQALGKDGRRTDLWAVPQVYRDLSTSNILTVQWLPGLTLADIAARSNLQEVDASDLARRLGLVWLQMALVGQKFPVEAEVIEMPDGRLAVTGGVFATLPEASRANWWSYVRATVEHFPDRAAASLLQEVSKVRPDAIEGELRTRVRQAVPFRDGGWSAAGESLGEYAILHWRLLRVAGYRARPHLTNFYMGLFWAARSARHFAPQGDPLGAASSDLDWLAGWNQFRQMASPQAMALTAESYMSNLVELPQKLDQILNMSTGSAGFRIPTRGASTPRGGKNSSVVVISSCLMMVALALVADPWSTLAVDAGLSVVWADRILALVFLAFGFTALKGVRRVR